MHFVTFHVAFVTTITIKTRAVHIAGYGTVFDVHFVTCLISVTTISAPAISAKHIAANNRVAINCHRIILNSGRTVSLLGTIDILSYLSGPVDCNRIKTCQWFISKTITLSATHRSNFAAADSHFIFICCISCNSASYHPINSTLTHGHCVSARFTCTSTTAMTAAHVQSLANAKSDITTLQAKMRTVQGAGAVVDGATVFHIATDRVGIQLFGYNLATGERETELQDFYIPAASQYGAGVMTAAHCKQLEALRQAVYGSDGFSVNKTYFPLAIEINRGVDALRLHGALALVRQGYTPYLFRYSKKRNKRRINGIKDHGIMRKGWNVVGDSETITFGPLEEVKISKKVLPHRNIDLDDFDDYQWEPRFFVSEAYDRHSMPYVPYGKSKVQLMFEDDGGSFIKRKVRLLYGLAFANQKAGKRQRLLAQNLVTPIVPFHICNEFTEDGIQWIFER